MPAFTDKYVAMILRNNVIGMLSVPIARRVITRAAIRESTCIRWYVDNKASATIGKLTKAVIAEPPQMAD
jgi:hypothetical protein